MLPHGIHWVRNSSLGRTLMTYGSKCPEPFMSESLRKIVIVETLFICIVSFFAQLAMLRATKRLSGWKSDFSFTIMIFMSAVAIQLYFGEIISHIRFASAVDTDLIDKILGAAFMTSFLTDVLLSITMIFHRVAYTFYPFAAPRVLNSTVLKTYLCMIGVFHLAMLGILISPLTGFIFCPKSLARFIEDDGVATPGLKWLNKVSNYMVGFAGLIAYVSICAHLFLRGSLTFSTNAEIRLSLQVVAMSTIGLLYFVYWEFGSYFHIPEPAATVLYETVSLLYFNAEFAPYMLLNRTFRDEYFSFIRRKKPKTALVFITRTDHKPHSEHT